MLKQIFTAHWGRIVSSYLVLAAENAIFALCPWLFGKAVDGLLSDDPYRFRLYMGLVSVGLVVGSARRVVDTRIFGSIWERFTTGMIVEMMNKGVDKSKTLVCSSLAPDYINFLEWYLPNGVRAVIFGVTSFTMLLLAVPGPGVWILVIAIGVVAASDYVAKRQAFHEGLRLDACEEGTRAINEDDKDLVVSSYRTRIHHYIKRSDWEAVGWGISDALSIVAEALVVMALVKSGASLGVVLATVVYVSQMFGSMNSMAFFIARTRGLGVASEKIKSALDEAEKGE